jgi:hypothetical protein
MCTQPRDIPISQSVVAQLNTNDSVLVGRRGGATATILEIARTPHLRFLLRSHGSGIRRWCNASALRLGYFLRVKVTDASTKQTDSGKELARIKERFSAADDVLRLFKTWVGEPSYT